MIMRSSWFQKPVYKKVNLIALIIAISGGVMIFSTAAGWCIIASVIILWLVFSALASYNISSGVYVSTICSVPVKEKLLCLTFDDGPCETTELLLKLLKNHNAKATFFITGENIQGRETIIRKIYEYGHEIGNHTYTHKAWFPLMSVKKIKTEIRKTQEVIKKITGKKPVCFRPPFGVSNPLIAKALRSFELKTIGWSVRSMDTTKRKPEKIINTILSQIQAGDIVLLHDTSNHIGLVLEHVLVYCKQKKFKLISISELIKNKL